MMYNVTESVEDVKNIKLAGEIQISNKDIVLKVSSV